MFLGNVDITSSPHGVTAQKNIVDVFNDART
jgi:hypothetical protein